MTPMNLVATQGAPAASIDGSEHGLYVDALTRTHVETPRSRRFVLGPVSLEALPGTITAVTGPSGVGKTTLLLALGLLDTFEGSARLNGVSIERLKGAAADDHRLNRVGFVFQSSNLVSYLTLREQLELKARMRSDITEEQIDTAIDHIGLTDRSGQLPAELSAGQQQRVAVARAILGAPALVLADEPTAALDVDNERGVLAMLRRFAEDGGIVVLSSHSEAAVGTADHVLALGEDDPR